MLKKFKKKSLKAKILIITFLAVLLALTAYVLYSNFKPEPPAEYEMHKVSYGTVSDTLDVSGTVESGVKETFTAVSGVKVQEVLVNVGDTVKKGDKLATFDVSGASEYLAKAKADFNKAQSDYNEAKKNTDASLKKKNELTSKINAINSQIAKKKNEISALEKKMSETEPVTEYVSIPEEQIQLIAAQMAQNGATAEQIEQFVKASSEVKIPVTSNNNADAEALMKKNLELAQLNSELASLQAENAVTLSSDNETMLKALKSVADTKKEAYESLKNTFDKMANGWYAENDGVVTAVNISAGEIFAAAADEKSQQLDIASLLGNGGVDSDTASLVTALLGGNNSVPTGVGITVESYEDMIAMVTVGKTDLLKLKTGMKAVVKSADKEYEGEIVYVGATAAEGTGLDLGSITSSIMGGSGSNGAIVKVKIKNPDKNVVIGFDVDIQITLSTIENVLNVPVETVIYNNGEYYVFVFDGKTVSKRKIERGILDDTSYEVTGGLTEGEIVVKTPDPNFEDGTKIREKKA